ncbi:unnamed protein product [Protopolystoma xenopodis]|uniref:Ig-like domain-containing protein n=1 Tax=Protopolystoma xenopodis TaxID=117903 RepID=A0A3S5C7W8_9PLAT|nr:unnamed protein product [Protopolystoma xenopodis]
MEDAGRFVCEASNSFGKATHSVDVEIGGIRAPVIIPNPRATALAGEPSKTLLCTVQDAKPVATVMWTKNGHPLPIDSPKFSIVNNNLVIRNIKVRRCYWNV